MSVAEQTKPALAKSPPGSGKKTASAEHPDRFMRETIESVVIAIILAFLFRTFEAEAFVIPTGSMAPTLQGAHRDVLCPQCKYRYRVGASQEASHNRVVAATTCPICRYSHILNPNVDSNENTFSGDRILVSKFAYQIGDPERWDPIVFKYPGNAKLNYIKRLVALPGEEGYIMRGDVYVSRDGQPPKILRKPPHKLVAMLQRVDDTDYIPEAMVKVNWPSRWQMWRPVTSKKPAEWKLAEDLRRFYTDGQGDETWMRYKHLAPFERDWDDILAGRLPADLRTPSEGGKTPRRGTLITDFYTYNTAYNISEDEYKEKARLSPDEYERTMQQELFRNNDGRSWVLGTHWVGDLALEAELDVQSATGQVLLDLVEGGTHYTCRIDVATGLAKLFIDNGKQPFVDDAGKETISPEATTKLRGVGKHHIRYSNCDDEVRLWIDDQVVEFNAPGTYPSRNECRPATTATDAAGDLAPAGIGSDGAALSASQVKIWRDVYYVGSKNISDEYETSFTNQSLTELFSSPEKWSTDPLLAKHTPYKFTLASDSYFPLGDNSPQSSDARADVWPTNSVQRRLLLGKALYIYWPHGWNAPIPWTPNVQRMRIIR